MSVEGLALDSEDDLKQKLSFFREILWGRILETWTEDAWARSLIQFTTPVLT